MIDHTRASTEDEREAARYVLEDPTDDRVAVDNGARVSETDDDKEHSRWVQAWVRVTEEDIEQIS